MQSSPPTYDVVIAGGGPAGLSAGLFTARYQLSTLILDTGKTMLNQCAYLDNYLGFPGGIDVAEFLALSRKQVVDNGCQLASHRVLRLQPRTEGLFEVQLSSGKSVLAKQVIVASGYELDFLQALELPGLFDEEGELRKESLDACGRTSLPGLYVTGPVTGVENQALICAGHGAKVALALIQDLRQVDGFWETLAKHLDWQVRRGCYNASRWTERVRTYFKGTAPSAQDAAYVDQQIERWIAVKRTQQIDRHEVQRRRARGRLLRQSAPEPSVDLPETRPS